MSNLNDALQTVQKENMMSAKLRVEDMSKTSLSVEPREVPQHEATIHDLIIIGAGPAALTTAIYTAREGIETLLLERAIIGGLAATTDWVDNYPGFPEGISGLELADKFRQQAERFGAKIEVGEVKEVKPQKNTMSIKTADRSYSTKAVLIATGCDYKRLNIPGEAEYYAKGVHYCATCDGAFYRDKKVVVIGGGNSAVQEALFLTRFVSHIDLLARDKLTASDILIKELKKNPKITAHLGISSKKITGDGLLANGVIAINAKGQEVKYAADGIFIFVGLKPNTTFLKSSSIELDEKGSVITHDNLLTTVEGIFAAGDVRSGATMQIASAVGDGATAALEVRKYLEEKSL